MSLRGTSARVFGRCGIKKDRRMNICHVMLSNFLRRQGERKGKDGVGECNGIYLELYPSRSCAAVVMSSSSSCEPAGEEAGIPYLFPPPFPLPPPSMQQRTYPPLVTDRTGELCITMHYMTLGEG